MVTMDDACKHFGIRTDAPEQVKLLCLELKHLESERQTYEKAGKEAEEEKDRRRFWLKTNYIDRRMNNLRYHIFSAWQGGAPGDIISEAKQELMEAGWIPRDGSYVVPPPRPVRAIKYAENG